jgi:uncharacterized lipoprotein YmbA
MQGSRLPLYIALHISSCCTNNKRSYNQLPQKAVGSHEKFSEKKKVAVENSELEPQKWEKNQFFLRTSISPKHEDQ